MISFLNCQIKIPKLGELMGRTKWNFSNQTVGAEVLKDEWELEAREVIPTNSQH